MDKIKSLTVTLLDGSTRTWTGNGTVMVERTGDTSSNVLSDNNIHYIAATLRFEKEGAS